MSNTVPCTATRSITIIEDDPDLAQMLSAILRSEGYRTLELSDGAAGRDAVLAEPPDLVILDWRLPSEHTGEVLLQQIRQSERTARLPILVCTADLRLAEDEALLQAHGAQLLLKPFEIDDLLSRINELILETLQRR